MQASVVLSSDEANSSLEKGPPPRSELVQDFLHHSPPILNTAETSTVRKGLLWSQRDRLFSRWKERYFVLTREYLNCFKKGANRISEMGEFLYKVNNLVLKI